MKGINIWSLILFAVILLVAAISFALFWPRNYELPPSKPLPTNQFWELATGSKIAYRHLPDSENRKPYPIIYLHGGPGGFITDQQVSFFSKLNEQGYSVYLYDQIGCGNSERLDNIGEYTAIRHVADLDGIIEKIGAEKVILTGQSWGSILATLYAAEHPQKIERMILMCPGPIVPFNYKLAKVKAPDSLDLKSLSHTNRQANQKIKNWRSVTTSYFARNFLKKIATDEEADAFQTHLNFELQKSTVVDTSKLLPLTSGGGYYVQQMTMLSLDHIKGPRQAISEFPFPTLIIKGHYDNQAWGFTNEYIELLPNAQFELIKNAGHATYLDQPKVTLEVMEHFLNQ